MADIDNSRPPPRPSAAVTRRFTDPLAFSLRDDERGDERGAAIAEWFDAPEGTPLDLSTEDEQEGDD